jgi:hypothetical protein
VLAEPVDAMLHMDCGGELLVWSAQAGFVQAPA